MATSADPAIVRAERSASPAFRRAALAVLALNVLVVLWGAFVRATGSGAGCGSHWPLCNGDVLPRAQAVETLIEFTHRLTSGLALLGVAGVWLFSRKLYRAGSAVRRAAGWSVVFILTEALLGAGLVLFRYVAGNASVARAFYLSAHLANTQILLACLTATVWVSEPSALLRPSAPRSRLSLAALALTLLVSITGAIAALGDTLFPATSFADGLRQELSSGAHFLLRLRVLHPALAILSALVIAFTAVTAYLGFFERSKKYATWVLSLLLVQLLLGGINVWLLAPIWMQIVHLLFADLLWISLVLVWLESADRRPELVP